MKRKYVALIITLVSIFLSVCIVVGGNVVLTEFIESINIVCKGQKFTSVEEAIQAKENIERERNDVDLDYCPPYKVKYTFDYEDNTIVFYSYSIFYDFEECSDYAVRILKHNDDGTLSFDSGFADFIFVEPDGTENYYYFTNIDTSRGKKSISFLYLPIDSDKDIYVDGIKANKIPVQIEDKEFYICYAISKCDTFLSNLFTSVSDRHSIEIK